MIPTETSVQHQMYIQNIREWEHQNAWLKLLEG